MTAEGPSREGWAPRIGDEIRLEDAVDLAFDYRGDVTLVKRDGTAVVGYLYNRDRDVAEPFVQLFDPDGGSHTVPYAEIRALAFTGRDTAAGRSYEAWLRQKAAKTEGASPGGA